MFAWNVVVLTNNKKVVYLQIQKMRKKSNVGMSRKVVSTIHYVYTWFNNYTPNVYYSSSCSSYNVFMAGI